MQADIDTEQLVDVIGDALIVSDPQGIITLWNPAAERIFGFTQKEAIGQSLDLIIPEPQRKRHWEGYEQTMKTGETRYASDVLRVPAITRHDKRISIAFTVALLFGEDQKVCGIVAVVRDETARFEEERKLKKQIAEFKGNNR